jgi:5'-nucleotidase
MFSALLALIGTTAVAAPGYTLTILHNNDGESQLVSAAGEPDFGGVARFKTLVDGKKAAATTDGTLLVSSGDNFLAGPEFSLSLAKGVPFFDTIAAEALGYDALALGNHDFDFGPDVLADFIGGFSATKPPFWVSANIDVSAEPTLKALKDAGTLAPSVSVSKGGEDIGIIGLETPNLPFISSPRDVVVSGDPADITSLAPIVQAQVDALTGAGVNKIILASHLQDIDNEIALAAALTGVDIIVGGGGDELLANPGDLLVPGDEVDTDHPMYPIVAKDKAGIDVPVVTTAGEYKYLGYLEVTFDAAGKVTLWSGSPLRVSGVAPDAVAEDPALKTAVTDPVAAGLAVLDADVLTTSTVDLDGLRSSVRSVETNEGNLIADALLFSGRTKAASFGAKYPDVALQNGGGIRNNAILPAGPITLLDTFDMVPFPNFVSVLNDVPASQFKEIMENAVSRVDGLSGGTGRFAQIAGFSFTYDPSQTAQELDEDAKVTKAGSRVRDLKLNDGTYIVKDGALATTARPVTIATIDFLARGGDQYPYRGHPFTTLGVTYQQALETYLSLGVPINSINYPEGGEGRITLDMATVGSQSPATGRWMLGGIAPFFFGNPGDLSFVGDWTCNGEDTPGLFRQSGGFVYLRNSNTTGIADTSFFAGNPDDVPLAGDWDGDGCDTVSVYRPSNQTMYVFDSLGEDGKGLGNADFSFRFGNPGDVPFAGDFDGDGDDTVSLHRPATGAVYINNDLSGTTALAPFPYGNPGDTILAGDWNGNGQDTVGAVRGDTVLFRNTNDSGFSDGSLTFLDSGNVPIVGRFGG